MGSLSASQLAQASPLLRQLVGLDYPYPQILDDAEAGNAEGRVA